MERRTVDPYRNLDVIDARGPRTNQAFIGSLALIGFLTNQEWLPALAGLQLLIGLTFGRRFCVACVFWFEVLQPRFGEGRIEDARPPRFANMVGAVFLTAATVCFLAGAATAGWALSLIVAALALFAAISGICVGCEVYLWVARMRGMRVERYPA